MSGGDLGCHVAETLEVLWRRVAMAVGLSSVGVVRTGLLNTSGCGRVGALIDGGLHLLQELVDVQEVVLGSQVGHWWEGILMLGDGTTATTSVAMAVTVDRDHRWASRHVVGHAASLDRNALEES